MKKLEKFCSYLCEELSDIPASGDNIHYTNLPALISILKDGKIKGSDYDIKTKKGDNKGKLEIATMRNTNINKYLELSGSVDNVKIALFTKRIMASVRNVKKEPIAELTKEQTRSIKAQEDEFENKYSRKIPVFKNVDRNFCSDFNLLRTNLNGKLTKDEIFVKKWVKKNNYPEKMADDICRYYRSLYFLRMEEANREREERFVVDENKGIPTKPELMQIEFIGLPSKDFDEYYNPDDWSHPTKEGRKELYTVIANRNAEAIKILKESDPNLLIRNNYFNQILMKLMMYKKRSEVMLKNNDPAK